MTVVHVLVALGVVVVILASGLALATAVIMAFMALPKLPRLAGLAKAAGDWFSGLILVPLVALFILGALGPLLVGLMFLGVGIYLIVAGAGTGDGGQIMWGVIISLLGLFVTWTGIRD